MVSSIDYSVSTVTFDDAGGKTKLSAGGMAPVLRYSRAKKSRTAGFVGMCQADLFNAAQVGGGK